MRSTDNKNVREHVITMADMCELAHELTRIECYKHNIPFEVISDGGKVSYTKEAQGVFDGFLDLIEDYLI